MQELRESLSTDAAGSAQPRGQGERVAPADGDATGTAVAGSTGASDAHRFEDEEPHQVEPPHARGLRSEQAADIILRIRPTRLALSSALEKAVRWTLTDAELTIFFSSDYPANAARGEEEIIRNAAADVLGKPVLVRIKVDADAVGPDVEATAADQDEQVEMVKRVFRGEIVDG